MMDRRTRPRELAGLPNLTDQQIADKEAENGLLQFDLMFEWIEQAIADGKAPLSPQRLREFQRLAVVGLEPTAGEYREEPVFIDGTVHVPPPWEDVPGHVDTMCAYVSSTWADGDAIKLAAYVMWRLNWIHPFTNGNGRTSRVASYLVLCAKLGANLPGDRTIPEIIDEDKSDYYAALDDADAKWRSGLVDTSVMENVIRAALEVQLSEALG